MDLCLAPFTQHTLRVIHAISYVSRSVVQSRRSTPLQGDAPIYLSLPPDDGTFGWFPVWATVSKDAMNILMQVFWWTCVFISFGHQSGSLSQVYVSLHEKLPNTFSKVVAPISESHQQYESGPGGVLSRFEFSPSRGYDVVSHCSLASWKSCLNFQWGAPCPYLCTSPSFYVFRLSCKI